VTLNEAQTRALQIDPQLRAADWKLNDRTQVRLEVPVDGYDAEPWNGVTDYCLYDASGDVLAVVEAKHIEDQLPLASRKEMRPMWRTRAEIEANLESRKVF
jgi:type I site-specific restriction endonuclease